MGMSLDFHGVGERAKSIAAIAAVLSIVLSAAWYVYRLDERIRTLEAQMQTLVIPPLGVGAKSSYAANPLAQACADLVTRYADQIAQGGGGYVKAGEIESMINKLGCTRK